MATVVNGLTITDSSVDVWDGYNVDRSQKIDFTFSNNSVTSINRNGYQLQAGDEMGGTTNNNLDGEIIIGNKFVWNNTENHRSNICHGVFVGNNINHVIKYNYIDKTATSIVVKSRGLSGTTGGLSYNIVRNSTIMALNVKGQCNYKVYNNTFYSNQTYSTDNIHGTYEGLICVTTNDTEADVFYSTGTKIKNNIIYTVNDIPSIKIESAEATVGLEINNNVYWCEAGTNGEPRFDYCGEWKSWSEWRGLGYDANSVILNPNFTDLTNLVPNARLNYGANLGSEFVTGLSTSAVWTVGSSPATANQDSTWQVGARVFATSGAIAPTVTTTAITAITETSASSGGNVTSDGGASVTARGVCWSTNPNPTVALSTKTSNGGGTGTFTSSITGLTAGTTYHVRAYATNSVNTSYGVDRQFTTTSPSSNIHYISPSGSDQSGTGSLAAPWASLFHACGQATTWGDVIHVLPGVYTEDNECILAPGVSIEGEGDSSHIISHASSTYTSDYATITLYSSSQGTNGNQSISYIKLDGDNLAGDYAIKVIQRSNVIIHHCTIVDFFIGGVAFWGQGYHDNVPSVWAKGNQLHNCFIQNCGDMSGDEITNGNSVSGAGMVHIGTQETMEIHDNVLDESVRPGHNGNILSAVWYYKDIKFYNNKCYKPSNDGDGIWNFMMEIPAGNSCYGGFEAYGNEFYGSNCVWDLGGDHTEKGIYDYTFYIHDNYFDGDNPTGSDSGKMAIDIEGLMNTDVWIKRNTFNNWPRAIVVDQGGDSSNVNNIWIENNLIVNSGMTGETNWQDIIRVYLPSGLSSISNLYIHNNVISPNSYTVSTAIKIQTNCPVSNVNIKNNIIQGHNNSTWLNVINGYTFNGLYITNNCLYNNISNTPNFSGNSISNYAGVLNSVTSNPLLNSDYSLQSNSPCRDAGTNVGIPYSGSAPDIGAIEYTVSGPSSPTVSTNSVTNVGSTTATCGGNVSADGGASVTARGVCWSTSSNPTIALSTKTSNGTGTGSFVSSITGLSPATIYHVRAYATNSVGTAYGSDVQFSTTTNVVVPTLTTLPVTNVSYTSADSGGNISSDGGGTIAVGARGVCIATHTVPTTSDTINASGTGGTGSYAAGFTNLTANTTYYIRAYATNSAGTGYGNQLSFTTLAYSIPTVTTTAITNITQTTASSGGVINNNGGIAATVKGVCWSTSPNPTTVNNKTTNGSGDNGWTSSITGLTANTLYYVRAYATNTGGTGYGNQLSFTSGAVIATLTTNAVTSITTSTAISGGNITSNGGASVTANGVCWNTSGTPTIADSKTVQYEGMGAFVSTLSGLSEDTLYYVRAYALNGVGVAYGDEKSFTTAVESTTYIGVPNARVHRVSVIDTSDFLLDKDSNAYTTVTIGTQEWIVENLRVTHYANGVSLPEVTDSVNWLADRTGAYCMYDNNYSNASAYGLLYNWYACTNANNLVYFTRGGVQETGWRIPTSTDFETLASYVGGYESLGTLKETGFAHWWDPNGDAFDTYGFSARGAGNRIGGTGAYAGTFYNLKTFTTFVSNANVYTDITNGLTLRYSSGTGDLSEQEKNGGYSVRCVRDIGESTVYDDWFLPSIDEVVEMIDNLYPSKGGFLSTESYWSSTEDSEEFAWLYQPERWAMNTQKSYDTKYVRAIRSFTSISPSYSVGDVGPAGGWIFYKNGNDYLEAASSDQSTGTAWSNITNVAVTGTGTAIGTGQDNTAAIIGQIGHITSAAKLCDDLEVIV
jgi:uncharacterized protein (TIGR02145 family)